MEKEFKELVSFLKKHKLRFEASEHKRIHTSDEAAAVRGVDIKTCVKALVFDVNYENKKDLIMVLVRGDHKVDVKKLKEILNSCNIKLTDPQEVLNRTGCEIGSVHPIGNLFGMRVYMDRSILENEYVNFSAGMHTRSIKMKSSDLKNVIKPFIIDISKSLLKYD